MASFLERISATSNAKGAGSTYMPLSEPTNRSSGQAENVGIKQEQPKPDNKLSFDTVMSWFEKPTLDTEYKKSENKIRSNNQQLDALNTAGEYFTGYSGMTNDELNEQLKVNKDLLAASETTFNIEQADAARAAIAAIEAELNGRTIPEALSEASAEQDAAVTEMSNAGYSVNPVIDTIAGAAKQTGGQMQSAFWTLLDNTRRGALDFAEAGLGPTEAVQELNQQYNSPEAEAKMDERYAAADKKINEGEQDIARVKNGRSAATQFLVDLGVGGIQLAGDMALGAINPALATAALATRTFGGGAHEAREAGADDFDVVLTGIASAGKEVILNKLLGGLGKVYGKSKLAGVADKVWDKIAKNPKVAGVLKAVFNTEGAEEMLSGLIDPAIRAIYSDKGLGEYSELELSELLYQGLVGQVLGAGATGVEVATNLATNGNLDTQMPKGEKSPQKASATQGDNQIPPSTTKASTEQSDELNSRDSSRGTTTYSRKTDDYGFNVRDKGVETNKQKDAIDTLLEAAGYAYESHNLPLPEKDGGDYYSKLRDEATAEYKVAANKFWSKNPDLDEFPVGHPLSDEKKWIRDRVKEKDDEVYNKAKEIREEMFQIKDSRNIPIKDRLLELQRLADEEYELGIMDAKREWIVVDGEIVDADRNQLSGSEPEEYEEDGHISNRALSNTTIGSKGNKGALIPDSSYPKSKISKREEPAAGIGTKVTSQMREIQDAERKAAHEAYKKDEAERAAKKTLAPPKDGWNKPIKKSPLDNELTETLLQKQAENDKIDDTKQKGEPVNEQRKESGTSPSQESALHIVARRGLEQTAHRGRQTDDGSSVGPGERERDARLREIKSLEGKGARLIQESEYSEENKKAVSAAKKLGVTQVAILDDSNAGNLPGGRGRSVHLGGDNAGVFIYTGKPHPGDKATDVQVAVHESTHNAFQKKVFSGSREINNRLLETFPELTKAHSYFRVSHGDGIAKEMYGRKVSELSRDERAEVSERIHDEIICDLVAGIDRAFDGDDITELAYEVRNELIKAGVFEENAFDSEFYELLGLKKDASIVDDNIKKNTTTIEDDLPFVMNDSVQEVKPAEASPKPELNPKAQAEKGFGKVFKDIQDSADRVETLKMFTEDERFKKWAGKNTSSQVNKAVGNLVQTVRDFSNGHADINKLTEAYKSASKDDALKPFVSNRILASLERTQKAYEAALSDSSTKADVNRFRYAANTSMKLIARRFELADQAVKNQLAIAEEAEKNAPKAFKKGGLGKLASAYASLQISGPNVFRWIDGFNPNSKGIGYATANAAEDCAAVKNIEKVNGNKFFAGLTKGKELDSFLRGERMTGVKIGGVELNEQQALTVIGMYKTALATSKDKLNGLEGIAIPDAKTGEPKFFKFDKDEDGNSMITQSVIDLESALGGSAKEYEKAYIKMLSYFSPKVREATEDIYGVATRMFEDGKYFPLRYAFEGENISDYVFSENIEESIIMDDDASTASPGITKSRTKESGEYLLIEPVTEVMNRYINQASDYIAYGGFAQRLELMNTSSVLAPSVSDTLGNTFGSAFKGWMDGYVEDMQIGKKSDAGKNELQKILEAGADKLRRNLAQSALTFNIGTPLKQYSAYWTSMGILKPTAVLKAAVANPFGFKNTAEGNAMAEARKLGNIDPTLNEILRSKDTWLGKLKEKSKFAKFFAESIGRADAAVINQIFTATIYDVASDNPNMDTQSAEFKRLVENKFEEVMLLTQSTSAKSIAPELQRTDNQLLKMMSMFRSQQMQELNRMVKAIGEANAAKGTAAHKDATKALKQAVSGQVASYLELSILTAVANAILHKHDQYEDEEDKTDWSEVLKKISIDFAENAAGSLWLGESVAQWIIEKTTKENEFYGIPLGPLSTLKNFANSVDRLFDKPTLPNLKSVASYAGNLGGIPVGNIYNIVNAGIMYAKDISGSNNRDYDDILKYIQNEANKQNMITGASAIERAGWLFGINAPSELRKTSYDAIEALMHETGKTSYTPANFEGKIEHDSEDYVLDKKQEKKYRDTAMETYYSVIDDIVNDAVFEKANTVTKEAMVRKAKDYAADKAKAEYFKSIGVDYTSGFKKIEQGEVIRGNDKQGNPKPDIPKINAQDIPEYLAYTVSYKSAVDSKDYKGIDNALASFDKLSKAAQMHFASDNQTALDVYNAGVSSKSYYSYKDFINAGSVKYDATSTTNVVKLHALVNARMTDGERDALARVLFTGNSKGLKAYEEAKRSGNIKAAADIYRAKYE